MPKVYTIPVVIVTLEEDEGPDAASFSVLLPKLKSNIHLNKEVYKQIYIKKFCLSCNHYSCCTIKVWLMMFNATFNNISVISWQLVLLVKKTGVPRENHWLVASHWQTLSHNNVSSTSRHLKENNKRRYLTYCARVTFIMYA